MGGSRGPARARGTSSYNFARSRDETAARPPPRPNSTPIHPPPPHSIHPLIPPHSIRPPSRADITNAALSGADSTAALGTKKTLKSERKADDVDARDASNPQAVTEYVNDMYAHFREKELETSVNPSVLRP